MIKIAFLLLLFSCQKKTVFQNWENHVDSNRKLVLKNSKKGITSKAFFLDEDCALDIKISGQEKSGIIEVLKTDENCQKRAPIKMQYQAEGERLKLCSDFSNGAHTCEMMVPKKNSSL